MKWKTEYSVGVEEFDHDHEALFDLVRQYEDAVGQHDHGTRIEAVFDTLIAYCEKHFAAEEQLMASRNYPGAAEHARQHSELKSRVLELQRRYQDGDDAVGVEIVAFLNNWLVVHILEEDMAYKNFFEKA